MEISPNLSDKAKFDLVLVDQAIAGDQKAYAELLDRYKDAIYFMLLKMVNNKSDAEDLTIEAFGKAFKNIHQYTPQYAFSTWLFRIASNNAIDFMRKKRAITVPLEPSSGDRQVSGEYNYNARAEGYNPEESIIRDQNSL